MSNFAKENYECNNCITEPLNEKITNVQNLYSPCSECSSIYNAKKIRTDYDKFWIQFYNNKAQNTMTDLLNLKFAK